MKVYIKYHNPICRLEKHGNWIDLKSSKNIVVFNQFDNILIPLGVSMKLPKHYEANLVPRSGTYKKYGLIQANHMGVIDGPDNNSSGYSGNNDVWMFNAIAMRKTTISEGDRICQFKIIPTMSAPWYVKLRWIFDSKIDFIETMDLMVNNRGGFGSTGV